MATSFPTQSSDFDDIYQPLDRSRREIRVLHLFPIKLKVKVPQDTNAATCTSYCKFPISAGYDYDCSENDDEHAGPVCAQLTTVSVLDNPSYTALSYTWETLSLKMRMKKSRTKSVKMAMRKTKATTRKTRPKKWMWSDSKEPHHLAAL